ncbi:GAF sensor-containing diguanylate cyclase [Candidatus Omnitrophus magneticus]|uniref:GAF sensor-containing diguanylate cyclase n=1 Tax=Candidatus Omnitrophus magneticus TaxID=1609969 RepID=A0A0F0CR15_9BACT|nr:GAF sensor-containing diguanylate cyclase [Candidatus Omnitrophus magneticus]
MREDFNFFLTDRTGRFMKKNNFIIFLEMLLAFFACNCVNYVFFSDDPGFLKSEFNPYWLIIFVITTSYGLLPGILSGLLASAHILLFTFGSIPTKTGIEQFLETGGGTLFLQFILASTLLGAFRQNNLNKEILLRENVNSLIRHNENLEKQCSALNKTRESLEKRIVDETSTFKILYNAAIKLEGHDAEKIYNGCLEILKEHFNVEKASIYFKENEYYVLKASLGWDKTNTIEGKVPVEESIMTIAFEKSSVINIDDILSTHNALKYSSQHGDILWIFPIKNNNNNTVGVVNIEQINFLSFTTPVREMISLVIEWVEKALNRKKINDIFFDSMINDIELDIYSFSYFKDTLGHEIKKAKRYGSCFTLALIMLNEYGCYTENQQKILIKSLSALIKKFSDNTDMIFKYTVDGFLVCLSPYQETERISEKINTINKALEEIFTADNNSFYGIKSNIITCDGNTPDVSTAIAALENTERAINALTPITSGAN